MSITIQSGDIDRLAKSLENVGRELYRRLYTAVNQVAAAVDDESQKEIVSRVNLTADYVRERIDLDAATPNKAVAVIKARQRATRLATYGAKQVVKSSPRAKGDRLREIAPGQRAAGVQVAGVKRGSGGALLKKSFLIPLKNGNGFGVFTRIGAGRNAIRQLYGLSVDQVFGYVIRDNQGEIETKLEAAIVGLADDVLAKSIQG